jgi:hypothetical protein
MESIFSREPIQRPGGDSVDDEEKKNDWDNHLNECDGGWN